MRKSGTKSVRAKGHMMRSSTFRKKAIRVWREWVRPLAVILIACGSFRSAVADWNDVPTGSMNPTIVPGDRIFVNKMAYGLRVPFTSWRMLDFAEPERGDIAVFFSPDENIRMVKRVIGLPGDRIEMRNNHLIINGESVA
jgi:signal peptidase I